MCFKPEGAIFTFGGKYVKWLYQFTYLGINISSTESDVTIRLKKEWTTIGRLLMLYQAYGCKERTKHRVENQITRQVKNLANLLTRIYVKLRSKMVGSCIDRNELTLGNLTSWIVVQWRHKMFRYEVHTIRFQTFFVWVL